MLGNAICTFGCMMFATMILYRLVMPMMYMYLRTGCGLKNTKPVFGTCRTTKMHDIEPSGRCQKQQDQSHHKTILKEAFHFSAAKIRKNKKDAFALNNLCNSVAFNREKRKINADSIFRLLFRLSVRHPLPMR